MEIVNLTPHPINLYAATGHVETIAPFGQAARTEPASRETVASINGFPCHVEGPPQLSRRQLDRIVGLVHHREDRVVVVSRLVLDALARAVEMEDLDVRYAVRGYVVAPDTSVAGAVRDDEGRIIGVRGFIATHVRGDV